MGRDWRKEARPGVSDAVAGAIPGLNFAKVLFSIGILFKIALEFGILAKAGGSRRRWYNSLPSSVVQCYLDGSAKSASRKLRKVSDILYSADQNSRKR